jgi:hypothetical protein
MDCEVLPLSRRFIVFVSVLTLTDISRDLKDLPVVFSENEDVVLKLEIAIASLQRTAAKIKKEEEKRQIKRGISATKKPNKEKPQPGSESSAEVIVPRKMRPRHRVLNIKLLRSFQIPYFIPFIGREVDTIDYFRERIAEANAEIAEKREDVTVYRPKEAAFIEFHSQIAAHMFAQYAGFSSRLIIVRADQGHL